ncbi:MAG: hypothetical protein RXQ68_02645 [Candidatus Nanopusillus sp.]
MKKKKYTTMLLFDLQSNKRILSSLVEIEDNINKHMTVEKNILI